MEYLISKYSIREDFIDFVITILKQMVAKIETRELIVKIPRSGKEGIPLALGHIHNNAEIFIQLEGATEYRFYDEVLSLQPNEVCVIPSLLAHSENGLSINKKFTNLVIMIEKKMLTFHLGKIDRENAPYIYHIEGSVVPENWKFFDLLMDVCKYSWRKYPESADASLSLLQSLLLVLVVFIKENAPFHFSADEKVEKCQRIVFCNIHDYNLSVQFIANQINLSPDYLSNYYKKKTGESLIDYINRQRLEKAVYFLEHSAMNVSEISYNCGYRNPGYFTRLFRRMFSKTPKEYRNSYFNVEHDPTAIPPARKSRKRTVQKVELLY